MKVVILLIILCSTLVFGETTQRTLVDATKGELDAPAHLSTKYSKRPTYISKNVLRLLPHKVAASIVATSSDELIIPDKTDNAIQKIDHPVSPAAMRFREKYPQQQQQQQEEESQNEQASPVQQERLLESQQEQQEQQQERAPMDDAPRFAQRQPLFRDPRENSNPQVQQPHNLFSPPKFGADGFQGYNQVRMPQQYQNDPQQEEMPQMPQQRFEQINRPAHSRIGNGRQVPLPKSVIQARLSRMRRRKQFNGRNDPQRFQQTNIQQRQKQQQQQQYAQSQFQQQPQQQQQAYPQQYAQNPYQSQDQSQDQQFAPPSPPTMPAFPPSPAFQPDADMDVDYPGSLSPQFQSSPQMGGGQFGLLEQSAKINRVRSSPPPRARMAPSIASDVPRAPSRVHVDILPEAPMNEAGLLEVGESEAANLAAGLATESTAQVADSQSVPNLAPTERKVSLRRDASIPPPPTFEASPPMEAPHHDKEPTVNGYRSASYDPIQLNREVFG